MLTRIASGSSLDLTQDSPQVSQTIQSFVGDYLVMSSTLLARTQPNYLPVTFTIWRRVALLHLPDTEDTTLTQFATKVDLELLELFRQSVARRYRQAIISENKYIPTELSLATLKQSHHFEMLANALAEWLTLMELCDDLMHRMVDYKIMHIFEIDILRKKLRTNWEVALKNKPNDLENLQDKAAVKLMQFFEQITHQLYKATSIIGIAGYAIDKASESIVGFSIANPSLIAAAVLGAVVAKLASKKLGAGAELKEIEQWAKYFNKVTNNLYAHY